MRLSSSFSTALTSMRRSRAAAASSKAAMNPSTSRPGWRLGRKLGLVAVLVACGVPLASTAAEGEGHLPAATAGQAPDIRKLDIRIGEGDATLAGTLVLPAQARPAPAVVIVSGSGGNDRYGHIRGFAAYGVIADHLARSGNAVLLLDRRGVGGSAGNWKHERIEDRTRDVLAATRWLKARPEVDPAHVGILGHSQGGWVAEQAAADSADVSFIVLMAGPGETVREQVLTDERNELLRSGRPAAEADARVRTVNRWLAVMDAIAPACRLVRLHPLCYTVEYDPAPALRRIHVPVLALFGGLDTMVPADRNRPRIEEGLQRAGNTQLDVKIFEGANHQFWPARTGARSEYASLVPAYVPGFLDTISTWIATTTGDAMPEAEAAAQANGIAPEPAS